MARVLGLFLLFLCWLSPSLPAAEPVRRIGVAGALSLALPSGLQAAAAPAAPALPGQVAAFFRDGAAQPLLLWVQSLPVRAPAALPTDPQTALEQLANGFLAGSSGAQSVSVGPYDPARRALGLQFQSDAGGVFAGVAFLTRDATVLALCAGSNQRAADVRAAAALIWEHSTLKAAALEPSAPEVAFGLGRKAGVVGTRCAARSATPTASCSRRSTPRRRRRARP